MRRLLALILVSTGFFVTACSSGGSNTAANSGATTTTSPTTTSATASSPSTASGAASSATLSVATDAKFGQILVDSQGRTVYIFDKDMGTTSACTSAACTGLWPAVAATGTPTGGTGVTSSMLGTAQGQVAGQVTYNGHLLYRFSGDTKAGDVNGSAIPNWHPVTPAGAAAS
jgi:predicted lipoprotein with Yx(FWY)xxD motif